MTTTTNDNDTDINTNTSTRTSTSTNNNKYQYQQQQQQQQQLFFLLNMLWSRHVKPSPAIGEKSERSEIRDIKVCTDWSFPESVKCTIYDPLYKEGWIKKNAIQKHATQKSTKSTHGSTQSISISK